MAKKRKNKKFSFAITGLIIAIIPFLLVLLFKFSSIVWWLILTSCFIIFVCGIISIIKNEGRFGIAFFDIITSILLPLWTIVMGLEDLIY